jgi:hypothetical protein
MKLNKKAAADTAAKKNKLHNKAYPQSAQQSRLKTLIGEILLFGNKQRKEFWELFEVLLTQYVQSVPEPPESKKSA